MTVTIDLPQETEARLRNLAEAKGKRLEDYLGELAQRWANEIGVAKGKPSLAAEKTPEQRVAELRAWANSHSHITAVADDSRESIYEGRGE
jgi:predicted DNA-binding protein